MRRSNPSSQNKGSEFSSSNPSNRASPPSPLAFNNNNNNNNNNSSNNNNSNNYAALNSARQLPTRISAGTNSNTNANCTVAHGVSDWSARTTTLRTTTTTPAAAAAAAEVVAVVPGTTMTTTRTLPPSARGSPAPATDREQQHQQQVNAVAAARERFSYVETHQQSGKVAKKAKRRKVDSSDPGVGSAIDPSSPATTFSTDALRVSNRDNSAAPLKLRTHRSRDEDSGGKNKPTSTSVSSAAPSSMNGQTGSEGRSYGKRSSQSAGDMDQPPAAVLPIASNEEPVRRKAMRVHSKDPLRSSASPSRARQLGGMSQSVDGVGALWKQRTSKKYEDSPLRQSYSSPLLAANVRPKPKPVERTVSDTKHRTSGRPKLVGAPSPAPPPQRTPTKQQQEADPSSKPKVSSKGGSNNNNNSSTGTQKKKQTSNPTSPAVGPSNSGKGNGLTRQRSRTAADTTAGTPKQAKISRGGKSVLPVTTSKNNNNSNNKNNRSSSSVEPVRRTLSRMESAMCVSGADPSPSRGNSVCRLSRHNTSVSRHNSISQNNSWRQQSRRQSMYNGLSKQPSHHHLHHHLHQELAPSSPVTIVMEGIPNSNGEDTTILSSYTRRRATATTAASSAFPDRTPDRSGLQQQRRNASEAFADRYDSDTDAKDETRARSRRIESRMRHPTVSHRDSCIPMDEIEDVMSDQISLNSSESDSSVAQRFYSRSQQRPSENDMFTPSNPMFKMGIPCRRRTSSISQNQKGGSLRPSAGKGNGEADTRDQDFSPSSRAGSLESSMSFDEEDEEEAVQQYMSSGWYSGTLRMPSSNTPAPAAVESRTKGSRGSKASDESKQRLSEPAPTEPLPPSPKKTAKEIVREYKMKNGLMDASPTQSAPPPPVASTSHSHSELLSKEKERVQTSSKPLIMKSRGTTSRPSRDATDSHPKTLPTAPSGNDAASHAKEKNALSRLASTRRTSLGNYNAAPISTSRRPSTCNDSRRNSSGVQGRTSMSRTMVPTGTTSTAHSSKRASGSGQDAVETKVQPARAGVSAAPVLATAMPDASSPKVPHEIVHSAVHATGMSRTATPSRMERSGRRTGHTYISNPSSRRCGTPQMHQQQDRAVSDGLHHLPVDRDTPSNTSTGGYNTTMTPRTKEPDDSMRTMQKAPLSSSFVEQLTSKLSLYDAFFLDETKTKWLVDDTVLAKVLEYVRLLGYEHPMLKEDEAAGRISLWADSTVTPTPITRTPVSSGANVDHSTNAARAGRGAAPTATHIDADPSSAGNGSHPFAKQVEAQRRYHLILPANCKSPSKSLFLESSEGLRWLAEQEYVVGTILLACCYVAEVASHSQDSRGSSTHTQSETQSHTDPNVNDPPSSSLHVRPFLNPSFHPITFCATYVAGSSTNWGDLSSFKDMWESQVKLVFTPFAPNHQKAFYYEATTTTASAGLTGGVVSGDAAVEGYRAIMETHREQKGNGSRRDKASPSRSSSAGGMQAPKTPREAPTTYTRLCFLSCMDSGNLMHVECAPLPNISAASGLYPTTPRGHTSTQTTLPNDQPQPSPRHQQQHQQASGSMPESQDTPVSPDDEGDDDDNSSSDDDGGAAPNEDIVHPLPSSRRQKGKRSKNAFVEAPALPLFSTTSPLFNFWLEPDAGSDKRLWFYFAVVGGIEGVPIQMRLMNAAPHLKLYRNGMKPVWRAGASQPHWTTAEHCVFRVKNGGLDGELMFVIHPKSSSEMILVAFCVPYSYSDMLCHISHWHALVKHSICSIRFEERVLTRTPDGRKMHLLIITSPNSKITRHTQNGKAGSNGGASSPYAMNSSGPHSMANVGGIGASGANNNTSSTSNGPVLLSFSPNSSIVGPYTNFTSGKKVVLISCRVHPGEVTASHGAHGLISFLLSSDPRAAALREHFIFYIVPMLNPDGVSRGHSRHDQRGSNLNRCYNDPDPVQQPTVCALRRVFEHLQCTFHDRFFMYVDFHSHASRSTGFIFGNFLPVTVQHWNMVFPRIIELHAREVFSFYQCRFGKGQMLSKDGTSRVLFGGTLIHSYTVELTHFTNFRCYMDDVEALNNGSPVFCSAGTLVGSRKAIEKQLAARSASASGPQRRFERSASKTKGGMGTPRNRQSDMLGRSRKDDRDAVNNLSFHSACTSGKASAIDCSPAGGGAGNARNQRSRAKSAAATTSPGALKGRRTPAVSTLPSTAPHIPSVLCNSADIGRACVLALLDYCAIPYPGCTYGGSLGSAPLRNRASNVGSHSNASNGSIPGSPYSANGNSASTRGASKGNGSSTGGMGAGAALGGGIGPVPMSGEFWSYGGMERVLREVKRQIRGN